jgi:hypothetical protein
VSDPATAPSYTVKAGRLLTLFAWLNLLLGLALFAFAALPLVALGIHPVLIALAVAALIGILVLVLIISAGLKRHRAWARIGAVIVSILSLSQFPHGTIIGAMSLFYLHKGWHEQPGVA